MQYDTGSVAEVAAAIDATAALATRARAAGKGTVGTKSATAAVASVKSIITRANTAERQRHETPTVNGTVDDRLEMISDGRPTVQTNIHRRVEQPADAAGDCYPDHCLYIGSIGKPMAANAAGVPIGNRWQPFVLVACSNNA